ncbi:MAG: glycyl-radical enzyme activating protein [Bacteroidales bacterium]|nr:glycyl-radical enzyme activating protein [Bacteroidota bacterium]MBL6950182.1 glycyl-radical enzyme activating protein [Bacteroidales bacterium]
MTKGLIFDIKRFAVHDGPGIRTTVFFKGCPLACTWCHNPESRSPEPEKSTKHISLNGITFEKEEIAGREMTIKGLLHEVERDRIFFEESGGGVTLSGGEPLFQIDFCMELLQALRKREFHTALDTTGYTTGKEIRQITPFVDLFLYDLKLMDDETHQQHTGVSNKQILENLKYLLEEGKNVIIRVPVVPGITDTQSNIRSIINFLEPMHTSIPPYLPTSLPDVHLLPYHTTAKNKYRRFHMNESMKPEVSVNKEKLTQLKREMERAGFKVKLGG